jgi:TolB-like protein/tetratricopeptide (TPR) repeat protein
VSGKRTRLVLLGRLRLEDDAGRRVEIRGGKTQALLAYLALPAGRRHHRDHLATLLWGEMGEERARHNLRQCISVLRKTLGGTLVAEDDTLALDPQTIDLDVACLEQLGTDQRDDAYSGELLEGFRVGVDLFDDWLEDQRGRLKRLACDRLGALCADRAAAGAIDDAIRIAQRQLTLDPSLEEAHRSLMDLYARSGRRSVALRQYDVCRKALARHFGAAPSAETVRLYESLREDSARGVPRPEGRTSGASAFPEFSDRPSIVVLPFANRHGDSDRDYIGIGYAEDITRALSRFGSLFVISPITTFALRGRPDEPRQLGRDLGVRYVVHGSVQQSGNRIRVTVHLVDAHSATELWAHRYDRPLSDLFAMHDEITGILVATLVGRVEAASLERIRRTPPESLAAYDCFLRGKEHHHRFTLEDNTRAIAMFERAVAIDPAYALAYAWLSCTLFQRTLFGPDPALERRSFEAIQRAHALDDDESEVHRILGAFHLEWKDFEQAEYHHERALALNPNDDRIVCQYGDLATYSGRPEGGERSVRQAMRLNPYLMPRYWLRLARALYHQGRFDEALAALHRETVPVPDHRTYLAAALARLGHRQEARAVVDRIGASGAALTVANLTQRLPYRRPEDLEALAEGLRLAGIRR